MQTVIDLYENASVGIVEISLDGKYINVNQKFCQITGYTKEELLPMGIHDLTYPIDIRRETDLYRELVSGSLPFYNIEERYLHKKRTAVWVEVIRSLVRDVDGKPLYTIGIVLDISHRKAVEEFLQKSEAYLQEKNIALEKRMQKGIADLKVANLALVEGRKSLQVLSQRLINAQEDERRIVARELHDGMSQSLSALKMNLILIGQELEDITKEETSARITDSISLVAEVIDLVRNVMSDLRPLGLDDYGLESALGSIAMKFHSRYNFNVRFEKSDTLFPRLHPDLELTLMRIAQEALSNSARHANTSEATLVLRQEDNLIYLAIEDTGVGIEGLESAKLSGNHGMTIMRERAEAFGGKFNVTSAPGQGTTIEVWLPLDVDK